MVASCSVDFKIMLEKLSNSDHKIFCTYHPETFPGLIYHMKEPKVCLLIFCSGKIVLTGAKNKEDIDKAYKKIQPTLNSFRKRDLVEEKLKMSNYSAAKNSL